MKNIPLYMYLSFYWFCIKISGFFVLAWIYSLNLKSFNRIRRKLSLYNLILFYFKLTLSNRIVSFWWIFTMLQNVTLWNNSSLLFLNHGSFKMYFIHHLMGFPFTGRLPLEEICEYDSQCMGNLSQCLQDELKGKRVCSCLKGYIAIGNQCYKSMYYKRKRRLFKSVVLVKNTM